MMGPQRSSALTPLSKVMVLSVASGAKCCLGVSSLQQLLQLGMPRLKVELVVNRNFDLGHARPSG